MKQLSWTRRATFERILSQYKTAWERRDAGLAVELFTVNATYLEDPFDVRPMKGRKEIYTYWAQVPKYQRNISFTHGPVFQLAGSDVWGAEWDARYTKVMSGERIKLKGVLFCKLSGRKISKFWEYWHLESGTPSFSARNLTRRRGAKR